MSIASQIEAAFEEWSKLLLLLQDRQKLTGLEFLRDWVPLNHHGKRGSEFITSDGYQHIQEAARSILASLKLEEKLQLSTAITALTKSFFAHIDEARVSGQFYGDRVEAHTRRALQALKRDDGKYVFPVRFAPQATKSAFIAGPIQIMSRSKFSSTFSDSLETASRRDTSLDLFGRWHEYQSAYDHFLVVDMSGYEDASAWKIAREVADYFLNLVRLLFGYHSTSSIKLSGDFAQEIKRSTLRFDPSGTALTTRYLGPPGGLLDDRWLDYFEVELGGFRNTIGSFALALTTGRDISSPVIERLRYAHRLIAEAYSEPHEPQRLVRFVSALETLSLPGGSEKAHTVSKHCACAGGWGDAAVAADIYDAVRNAYHWRSSVVHGDTPKDSDVRAAFVRVEKYAFPIVLGYMVLYTAMYRERPQSVRSLRGLLASRISHFFWDFDLALLRQ